MATSPTPVDVNDQRGLDAIYEATESLAKAANEMFQGVENDIPVSELAAQAMDIRIAASRLEATLDSVVSALTNLG